MGDLPHLEAFLGRLRGVTKNGRQWRAFCPAHDDHEPSLSVTVGDDDCVLVKCFAGCTLDVIVEVVGLTVADLFSADGGGARGTRKPRDARTGGRGGPRPPSHSNTRTVGLTLAEYAEAKQLPIA